MEETVQQEAGSGTASFEMKLTMEVTDLAKTKLGEFLGDKPIESVGVRIGVQPGGCSGATYDMAFSDTKEDHELELIANGVRLFVDPSHAPLLQGLRVDYLDELMGGGFKIHNPNATSTCGCGKSFSA